MTVTVTVTVSRPDKSYRHWDCDITYRGDRDRDRDRDRDIHARLHGRFISRHNRMLKACDLRPAHMHTYGMILRMLHTCLPPYIV